MSTAREEPLIPEEPTPEELIQSQETLAKMKHLYKEDKPLSSDSLREQILNVKNVHGANVVLFPADLDALEAFIKAHSLQEQKLHEIELLKKDIRYHTLKARWQRIYLGGEQTAVSTKRYVKQLKARLKQLEGKTGDADTV